ncbi:MAG: alpha/beta hydrolase-fold protein [Gemmatimonadales bacterium]
MIVCQARAVFAGFILAAAFARNASAQEALTIGSTFTIQSAVLGEVRRINVYVPPGAPPESRLPVMFLLDGGIAEDFLHIAGLVQVSVGNGTMRPFILVGIENTERRRDFTGPTANARDSAIAPRVGGSAAFRSFLRTELIPAIERRESPSAERAIIGESLAGLFVVETFLLEPSLFSTYIAIDPSLWWNDNRLVVESGKMLRTSTRSTARLHVAHSGEPGIATLAREFADSLGVAGGRGVRWRLDAMPTEGHGTIFHPAALRAVRWLFPVPPAVPAIRENP